ncbi:hypothetical protein VCHFU02_2031, partial [Vibrio cholerae HFU-02]
MAGKLG